MNGLLPHTALLSSSLIPGDGRGVTEPNRKSCLLKSQKSLAKRKFPWDSHTQLEECKRENVPTEPKKSQRLWRVVSLFIEKTQALLRSQKTLAGAARAESPQTELNVREKQDVCCWVVGVKGTFLMCCYYYFKILRWKGSHMLLNCLDQKSPCGACTDHHPVPNLGDAFLLEASVSSFVKWVQ